MSSTPPLPSSLPPEASKIDEQSKEKWILNEDIEVTQFSQDSNPEDPSQVASQLRLQADLDIVVPADDKLLKPAHVPKRRRSPVTVQEWVASLPIPHLLERQNHEGPDPEEPSVQSCAAFEKAIEHQAETSKSALHTVSSLLFDLLNFALYLTG